MAPRGGARTHATCPLPPSPPLWQNNVTYIDIPGGEILSQTLRIPNILLEILHRGSLVVLMTVSGTRVSTVTMIKTHDKLKGGFRGPCRACDVFGVYELCIVR